MYLLSAPFFSYDDGRTLPVVSLKQFYYDDTKEQLEFEIELDTIVPVWQHTFCLNFPLWQVSKEETLLPGWQQILCTVRIE